MAPLRRASALLGGGLLLFTLAACEKLIGIEDTPVAPSGAGDTSQNAGAAAGDDESAGETNGGAANGGTETASTSEFERASAAFLAQSSLVSATFRC